MGIPLANILSGTLPAGWVCVHFGKLFEGNPRNGVYKKKDFHGRGVKVVNMGELFAYDFISAQEMKRVELSASELQKYRLLDGDLLFARRSLVLEGSGKCSIVVSPLEYTTFESSIIRIRLEKKKVMPIFYFYLFHSSIGRALIASIATRTAVSGIRASDLPNLEVPFPPLPTQRKIASILSAYDDLIENNLRRIKILKEMAQTLYREWFVKFRFPGHEKVQMVDSPLGKIPEGWEIGSIGAICQVLTGFAFKSKDWSLEGIPVIKIRNIRPGNYVETEQVDHVPEDIIEQKHEKYFLKSGDFLIAMTGATAGKVGKLRTTKQMALNQRVAKIEPTDGFYEYIWCRISNAEAEKEFYRLADGAAQPNMSSSQIEGVSLLIPSSEVRGQFSMIVSPILQQVDNLIFRNTTLRQTRVLLLPKLISGELDVSDLDIKTGGYMQ